MRSVVYNGPGQLELQDTRPPVPDSGEVLVRVSHVGTCGSDLLIWSGGLPRVCPPVILGHEFSGVVETPGPGGLRPGDRVAVEPLLTCGHCAACRAGHANRCGRLRLIGIDVNGAAADYVVVPAHRCHVLPDSVSLRDAVLTEPLAVAVHMVRQAGVGLGNDIAVLGGGTIGSLVAALCAHAGAGEVTVFEPDARRRDLVTTALGVGTAAPGTVAEPSFDVTFEASGSEAAIAVATGLTRPGGTVLLGGLPSGPRPIDVPRAVLGELHLVGSRVYRGDDFEQAVRLLARGVVPTKALLTDEVPLDRAIEGAYGAMRSGRTLMKTFISVSADEG